MIKNPHEVEQLKKEYRRKHPLTIEQKYAILNAMYDEVMRLGKLEKRTAQRTKQHTLAIARTVNVGV
jgi:hypothetical protein